VRYTPLIPQDFGLLPWGLIHRRVAASGESQD
jgi:hypothetical protein